MSETQVGHVRDPGGPLSEAEGVGMPEASPMGARSYRSGAWYEWGKPRKNMLDALGGTLDSDADVDQPADLGVWWGDSLPTGRMASSLSDSDSF